MREKRALQVSTHHLVAFAITVLWVAPVVWMFVTGLKDQGDTFTRPPEWIAPFTLSNMENVIADWPFFRWLLNSLFVAGLATGLSTLLAILASYSFARMRWKGRDVVFMVFLASMLIPWQINAVPLYFLMDFLNLLNTRIAVVLPIVAMPISVFLLRQFFVSVPRELEDTAKIDGLGTMGIIWRVIVPVSLPAISALVIYMFIFTWNEYFWSLVALQDTELFTIPIGLKALQGAHDIKYNLLMAGASMAAIPILIVYLILQRRIISGLAMSSK
jgi:ABC-type glycerol-3-phosphate transport system permease component